MPTGSLISIADQIRLPHGMFDNETFANLKLQGVNIVQSGLMTVEDFNKTFAEMFNAKCKVIVGNAMTENMAMYAAERTNLVR